MEVKSFYLEHNNYSLNKEEESSILFLTPRLLIKFIGLVFLGLQMKQHLQRHINEVVQLFFWTTNLLITVSNTNTVELNQLMCLKFLLNQKFKV